MEIIMNYKCPLKNADGRWKYEGEIDIKYDKDKTYKCVIEAITSPTNGRSSAYLIEAKNIKTMNQTKDLKVIATLNRSLYKLFLAIDIKINLIKQKVDELTPKSQKSSKELFKEENLNNFFKSIEQMEKSFKVNDEISLINFQLNKEEMLMLSKIQANSDKLIVSSTLKRLERFHQQWKKLVEKNVEEKQYQELLTSYNDLFPIIFGLSKKCKTEVEHKEKSINRIDIEGEDWIIELKKPSTKLFAISKSRNNICGISSDFASAENQISLYIKKINREKDLLKSFTTGILIIGNSNEINNEEKKLTFEMMREKSVAKLLTFNDITKILEKCIKNYE